MKLSQQTFLDIKCNENIFSSLDENAFVGYSQQKPKTKSYTKATQHFQLTYVLKTIETVQCSFNAFFKIM